MNELDWIRQHHPDDNYTNPYWVYDSGENISIARWNGQRWSGTEYGYFVTNDDILAYKPFKPASPKDGILWVFEAQIKKAVLNVLTYGGEREFDEYGASVIKVWISPKIPRVLENDFIMITNNKLSYPIPIIYSDKAPEDAVLICDEGWIDLLARFDE